jgi:hypothetical protein
MSFTVVPLHNLNLATGTTVPFGNGLVLQDVPQWVKDDTSYLADINLNDRQETLDAKHAFVAEYEAEAIGEPDPNWKGTKPKSIQDVKFQSAMLANLALWLRQPSPVCFTVGFHALSRPVPDQAEKVQIILQAPADPPLYCHPNDLHNPVKVNHLVKAGELHVVLSTVPRKNAVWAALRAIWAALTSYQPDYRYPLFWQGLESLFGADDDSRGISQRLRDRISILLGDSAATRQALCEKVRACYKTRSEIVHGRWEEGPELEKLMGDTEAIVRTVMRHLLEKPGMLETFISAHRDSFLEEWVQSKSLDPPPFPK